MNVTKSQILSPETLPIPRPGGPDADTGGWKVILYNCDCHSFDEVIHRLQVATGCTQAKAEQIAEEAHHRGRAIAYTGEEAECERVAGILRAIRLQVETDRF